jgi:hypothetical protein
LKDQTRWERITVARRIIDISVPLHNDVAADPPGHGPVIEYIDHQQSLTTRDSSRPEIPGNHGFLATSHSS